VSVVHGAADAISPVAVAQDLRQRLPAAHGRPLSSVRLVKPVDDRVAHTGGDRRDFMQR